METIVNGSEKNAAFYRGYLADDRSFGPLAFVLAISVVVWMAFYLTSLGGQPLKYDPLAAAQAIHATDGAPPSHGAYTARRSVAP
jgi:hypothetical protein